MKMTIGGSFVNKDKQALTIKWNGGRCQVKSNILDLGQTENAEGAKSARGTK